MLIIQFESEIQLKMINFVEEFKNMSNLMKKSTQTGNREKPYLCDLIERHETSI